MKLKSEDLFANAGFYGQFGKNVINIFETKKCIYHLINYEHRNQIDQMQLL